MLLKIIHKHLFGKGQFTALKKQRNLYFISVIVPEIRYKLKYVKTSFITPSGRRIIREVKFFTGNIACGVTENARHENEAPDSKIWNCKT